MKSSNTVVTIVVIAAALLGAYGVGLLIHRARMGGSPSPATDANAARLRDEAATARGPGVGKKQDTPEMRAKLKEKRAEALEKMETATPEQQEQVRQQIRERFSGTRTEKKSPAFTPGQPRPAATPPQTVDANDQRAGAEPNTAG